MLPFEVPALQRHYDFLELCPEHLLQDVVTTPIGSLRERVIGVRQWRDALLAGHLPPPGAWPPPEVADPARRALEAMGLAQFCKNQPELVDAVIRDLLKSFVRRADWLCSTISKRLAELEKIERLRLSHQRETINATLSAQNINLDDACRTRLLAHAKREAQCTLYEASNLHHKWGERVRAWASISAVFGDLGKLLGRGWDLSTGVLQHTGWTNLVRLRALIAQLPRLREIIQSLGRLHATDGQPSVAETVFVPIRRLEEERLAIRTRVPAETTGIERSGDIARMLSCEATMLVLPEMRYLWHARRAERALVTYRLEGTGFEKVLVERECTTQIKRNRPRPERGPIIAIIDTSGSMHGIPERVAKALVLEVLRTAHAENRECYLYSYSGPGQIKEHRLELSQDGIGNLLDFLGLSFHGGNDEAGVLARVIKRLQESDWKKADVVFVSDGEWPAPTSLIGSVEMEKDNGTRFHGVQIGNSGHSGLHSVCSPVHVFTDWASAAGWG